VLVKGVGPTFAGLYYVTEVIHRFTPEEYTQRFKAVRNAVDLTGSEAPRTASAQLIEVAAEGRTVSPP
jgi:hypothetical protein